MERVDAAPVQPLEEQVCEPSDAAVAHCTDGDASDEKEERRPQLGDEVLVSLKARAADGSTMDDRPPMEYEVGSNDLGPISGECERLVQEMRVGEERVVTWGGPAHDGATLVLTLEQVYHTQDVSFAKDRAVVKKRLKAGIGGKPKDASQVKLSVQFATDSTGGLLSSFEANILDFTLGNGEVCDALECAAMEMLRGERASLKVSAPELAAEPRLGLAEVACERVLLTVELAGFDDVADPASMSPEEAFAFASARKEVGTALFKAGRFPLALRRYSEVAELMSPEGGGGDSAEARRELRKVCWLNAAACLLKTEAYNAAAKACDAVLEGEPENLKALYRRAQAEFGRENLAACARDCRAVVRLDASNREARALLLRAQEGRRSSRSALYGDAP